MSRTRCRNDLPGTPAALTHTQHTRAVVAAALICVLLEEGPASQAQLRVKCTPLILTAEGHAGPPAASPACPTLGLCTH